tara:strand:- start:362 stop:586 length:225 start_codon:yes stop_codon:yes gene_type:complete
MLKELKEGMKAFGNTLTTLINSILLFVVYLIGIGITSIIARIVGKKFLDTEKKDSYWKEYAEMNKTKESRYRQF